MLASSADIAGESSSVLSEGEGAASGGVGLTIDARAEVVEPYPVAEAEASRAGIPDQDFCDCGTGGWRMGMEVVAAFELERA